MQMAEDPGREKGFLEENTGCNMLRKFLFTTKYTTKQSYISARINVFQSTEVAKLNSSKVGALNLAKFNENENYLDNRLGTYEL